MTDFILNLERGHWQSTPPASSECQEISGLGIGSEADSFQPSASLDDVHAVINLSLLQDQGAQAAGISPAADTYWSGIRFIGVDIPNGATIQSAYIEFQAAANDSIDCRLQIIGEQSAAPAIYSTYANFRGRLLTNASYVWPTVEPWTQGAKYRSPDITAIVQEIVNLGAWASGNNMAIQVWELGSSTGGWRSWASVTNPIGYDPATLHVIWEAASQVGREATCEKEVYVANKHNEAQLTNIYVDDGGVWSANRVGDSAYSLMPAVPILNDAAYFGVDTTTVGSGPFCSLVFDLDSVDATGDFVWEYWNGAAWHAFTAIEICDNTSDDQFNNPFRVGGVRSVHWTQMSDWATRDISIDGGPAVTGYFVRCRCTVAADTVTQQSRPVYSILWPYVTVETAPGGDIPAIIEVQFEPKSMNTGVDISPAVPMWSNKVLMGLRSLERGANFSPYINLQNEQNPEGITVAFLNDTSASNDATTATGRVATYNPAGIVAQAEQIQVQFTRALAAEYAGTYRMFLRGRQSGGSADELFIQVEQKINTYTTLKWSDVHQFPANGLFWQLIDIGPWSLPGFTSANADEAVTGLELVINCESTDGTPGDLIFNELILWPIDEWAGEFVDEAADAQGWIGGDRSSTGVWRYLSVDSVGNPRHNTRSLIKSGDLDVRHSWRPTANGPAILQTGQTQRLWFLSLRNNGAGSLPESQLITEPYIGSTVLVKKAQRYLGLRGAD
jgi:hypothetical protein